VTTEEICASAAGQIIDKEICSNMSDCAACVGTALMDNATTCQWFEVGTGYCDSACGMNGCGTTTCNLTVESAPSLTPTSDGANPILHYSFATFFAPILTILLTAIIA
jgi:hypothetical protein